MSEPFNYWAEADRIEAGIRALAARMGVTLEPMSLPPEEASALLALLDLEDAS